MASPTWRPYREKSASVWSGLKPQRVVICDLPLATSTMMLAPSSPMSFRSKLWTRVAERCQRLLTLCQKSEHKTTCAHGGVLDVREGRVDLEHVGDVPCALCLQLIVREAANESEKRVSAAADT